MTSSSGSGVQVQEFMTPKPIHINEDDSLTFVMNIFERTHISGAPVINAKGEYVGVISKTDLAGTKLLKLLSRVDQCIAADVMNPGKPLTIPGNTLLEKAISTMLDKHVHRLFVHDQDGRIIGVLSSFDVMKAVQYQPAPDGGGGKKEAEKPSDDKIDKLPDKEVERRIFSLVSQRNVPTLHRR